MNSYHKFLIKQRVYCEYGQCLRPATVVKKDAGGHDICLCDQCAGKPRELEWDYVPKSSRCASAHTSELKHEKDRL